MKLRLNNEYTIAFPIAVCEPLNADFDGDTVSIQLVPEEVAEDTYNKMSPRYVNTLYWRAKFQGRKRRPPRQTDSSRGVKVRG